MAKASASLGSAAGVSDATLMVARWLSDGADHVDPVQSARQRDTLAHALPSTSATESPRKGRARTLYQAHAHSTGCVPLGTEVPKSDIYLDELKEKILVLSGSKRAPTKPRMATMRESQMHRRSRSPVGSPQELTQSLS